MSRSRWKWKLEREKTGLRRTEPEIWRLKEASDPYQRISRKETILFEKEKEAAMVIGVTGGVGAGKSTVLGILKKDYQAKLIIADDVAKELMEKGGASYDAVIEAFGKEILNEAGEIDRPKLSSIVFENEEKLKLLNSLTHPKVKEEILSRISAFYEEDKSQLIVIEAALLIEAGYEDILDSLWFVYVEKEIRIGRLMRDRAYTRDQANGIMSKQLSDEEFREHADFIVDNSGTLAETAAQVAIFFANPSAHLRTKE